MIEFFVDLFNFVKPRKEPFFMVQTQRSMTRILLIGLMILAMSVLAACNPNTSTEPGATEQPQNQVALPVVGSEDETETQVEEIPEPTAYPEPVAEAQNATNAETTQTDAYPAPTEEPITEENDPVQPKPTSRGNDLVATDPSTVALASGKVQLVEFFAFW
jgi:hypothetical protein